jgi:hypothetical protein
MAKAVGATTVVSCVYTGNDLGEELFADRTHPRESTQASMLKRAGRRLYLYHALGGLLPKRSERRTLGTPGCEIPNSSENVGAFQQALWQACILGKPAQFDESLRLVTRALKRVRDEARSNDMSLMVLVMPSKLYVEPQFARPRAAPIAALLDMPFDRVSQLDHWAHQEFLQVARSLGIPAIDIADVADYGNNELFYPMDWHLNRNGHAVVASVLVKKFEGLDGSSGK